MEMIVFAEEVTSCDEEEEEMTVTELEVEEPVVAMLDRLDSVELWGSDTM